MQIYRILINFGNVLYCFLYFANIYSIAVFSVFEQTNEHSKNRYKKVRIKMSYNFNLFVNKKNRNLFDRFQARHPQGKTSKKIFELIFDYMEAGEK